MAKSAHRLRFLEIRPKNNLVQFSSVQSLSLKAYLLVNCITKEFLFPLGIVLGASQVALVVKNLPANVDEVRNAGWIPRWGRSPEEGMTAHSSILAWRIPGTEEPGRLQSIGSQRVGHD